MIFLDQYGKKGRVPDGERLKPHEVFPEKEKLLQQYEEDAKGQAPKLVVIGDPGTDRAKKEYLKPCRRCKKIFQGYGVQQFCIPCLKKMNKGG